MVFWISILFMFCLGAVLGSFTTAIVYRIQNNESWIFADGKGAARSSCPACHQQLSAYDLVPILSWVVLKGRCRYCRNSISKQYVLTEIVSSILVAVMFLCIGVSALFFITLSILPFTLAQTILIYQNRYISAQLLGIIAILTLCIFISLYT